MEKTIKLHSNQEAITLYGSLDENLRYAEKEYHVRISARNHRLKIIGNPSGVNDAYRFFYDRLKASRRGMASRGKAEMPAEQSGSEKNEASDNGELRFFHKGKVISARSKNQAKYLEAIRDHDIVISIGPAGTGKTYLAMAAALDHLKKKKIRRIILTRPAVEAGESLGFLPGDLQAKANPYLRPLYDALDDMMEQEDVLRAVDRGVIEVAPLAYMRGRTLNDSFVILDEAQNCTTSQMKMFLTRLGPSSRAVVTGDVTQIDLPGGKKSGLVEIQMILTGIKGIRLVYLTDADVTRHRLVQEIIKAYERYERKRPRKDT